MAGYDSLRCLQSECAAEKRQKNRKCPDHRSRGTVFAGVQICADKRQLLCVHQTVWKDAFPKEECMEEVKSFRAGTGLSDQSAFNPFAFRISGRYRHAAVCLCSANATLDETGKKSYNDKRKNSRRRAAGAGSRKTKGKDKGSKTGGNGFPGTRYFCAVKEKRKAEPFRLKENRSHYAIRQQFTRNVTEYRS